MSRQPQARKRHAAVGVGQKLYVWAGNGASDIQTTTIESFDVSSEVWEEPRQLQGPLPDGLRNMAVATDGESAYSFGGACDPRTYLNKLYQIDLSGLKCKEVVPTNTTQAPKKGSRMIYFNQKLVLHGGFLDPQGVTDELHVFDLEMKRWIAPTTTGEAPPSLASHTFTLIDHSRAVVFGGYTGTSRVNDAYVLDMEKWHWTKIEVSGAKPSARSVHAACCIAGPLTGQKHPLLMVVGGYDGVGVLDDVWLLDVDKSIWTKVNLPTPLTPRDCHSAAVFGSDSNFRIVVLFGGKKSPWPGDEISETTLLCFEPKSDTSVESALWQVTRVVKSDQLGKEAKKHSPQKDLQIQGTVAMCADIPQDTSSPKHTVDEIDLRDLDIKKDQKLGKGGYGNVFVGHWKKGEGMTVAVKVTQSSGSSTLPQEIKVWRSLPSHQNIITLLGVANDHFNTFIVTELATNGSLFDYLHIEKNMPSVDRSISWASHVAQGMKHLHDHDIIHRDLKSANVLLTSGWVAKLCDFGTARVLTHTTTTEQAGTNRWMPPEILRKACARINKKCDLFSYGMILFELFAHKIPYADSEDKVDVLLMVVNGERPPIPINLPPYLHDILRNCWEEDPYRRPTFDGIVQVLHSKSK